MNKDIKKYVPWIVLLLVIGSLSSIYFLSRRVTQEQISAYESRLQEAERYIEARQYSMSIEKYYEAVDIIPKKVDAFEGIISVLLLKNRFEEAEQVVEKSATLLSYYDKSILYKMVGDKYYEIGDYSKAHDMYDNGLVLGVRNTDLEVMYGKVMLKMGDISEAKKYLQRSGFNQEQQTEANLILAYIYSTEDIAKAEKFLKAVEPTSGYKVYYEEFSKILNDLDEDVKFNATKLSRIYINEGFPHLAITLLEPLQDDIVEYLEGMYFLGRAYFEFGDYPDAIEVLNGASTLGGMETEIFWIKARAAYLDNNLESSLKDYDNAIGYMEEGIEEEVVAEYLDLLLEMKQKLKAEEVIRTLVRKDPENIYLNLMAVEVNYKLEEMAKVDYYLRQLEDLELDDNQKKEYIQWKLHYLFEEGGVEDIEEYLEELFEIDRFNPYYHYFLAKSHELEGNRELAIQSLERSLEYDLNYEITEEALKMLSFIR
jgi:predicted Zn-dependent protease